MDFNQPTIPGIKEYILEISKYHLSSNPNERSRAKECISQLTSEERKYLLKIINHPSLKQKPPSEQLSNKLSRIKVNDPIVKDKDAHLNRVEKSLMGVWRSGKNILGRRKSSDRVLKEIDEFAISEAIIENQMRISNLCFNPENNVKKEDLLKSKKILEQTSNYSKEIFKYENDYKALGLVPGSTFDKVTKAYEKVLKNRPDAATRNDIDKRFQHLYFLNEVEKIINSPINLEKAFQELDQAHEPRLEARLLRAIETLCKLYSEMEENKSEIENIKKSL